MSHRKVSVPTVVDTRSAPSTLTPLMSVELSVLKIISICDELRSISGLYDSLELQIAIVTSENLLLRAVSCELQNKGGVI